MKLYILRPKENLPEDDNPWEPWYDKSFGFIVRADSVKSARRFAGMDAGDEDRHAWIDEKYSICEEITVEGNEGMVMKDFHAA